MSGFEVLAGLLAGAAHLVAGARRAGLRRLQRLGAPASAHDATGQRALGAQPRAPRGVLVILVVPTGAAIVGDVSTGVFCALLVAAAAWLRRQRGRSSLRRRHARAAAAVTACADLLAACLTAGATPAEAVADVALVADPVLQERLDRVASGLRSGVRAEQAWLPARDVPALDALARAFIRADSSGAALAATVSAVAEDQRRARRWAAEAAARRAGIQAVAPLVVCFLPAFLLVGVVPVIVGIAAEVVRLQ